LRGWLRGEEEKEEEEEEEEEEEKTVGGIESAIQSKSLLRPG
jgi:hypothetical protein